MMKRRLIKLSLAVEGGHARIATNGSTVIAARLALPLSRPCCGIPLPTVILVHTMDLPPIVTMHVLGALRVYCGGASELSIPAHTVRGALESLQRSQSVLYRNICDETGAVRRHLNVFVNSADVRDLDGLDTSLVPGDVVTILPAVSGG